MVPLESGADYPKWMRNVASTIAGTVLVCGCLSFAGGSRTPQAMRGLGDDKRIMEAFARVKIGVPASSLEAIGFDPSSADRLSRIDLQRRFIVHGKTDLDSLDPAVKNCYLGPDDCAAYFFDTYTHQIVLLVQGGRVTWKFVADSMVN